jgi:maltooligosyltrehalose trehalohydrolase
MPRLVGARALDATPLGIACVFARWRCGDGAVLSILANFAPATLPIPADIALPDAEPIFGSARMTSRRHCPPYATFAWLEGAPRV